MMVTCVRVFTSGGILSSRYGRPGHCLDTATSCDLFVSAAHDSMATDSMRIFDEFLKYQGRSAVWLV